MVERLRDRIREERLDNVDALQADVMDFSFPDGRFDAVVAANVLHLRTPAPRSRAWPACSARTGS